jgi:hypothetical protein
MKKHGVERAGCAWFGSVCCWVNRDPPSIWFGITFDNLLPKESVYAGQNGWRVGWAPTLPEAFMIALMSQRLEGTEQP